jgi:hypothetical protein
MRRVDRVSANAWETRKRPRRGMRIFRFTGKMLGGRMPVGKRTFSFGPHPVVLSPEAMALMERRSLGRRASAAVM